MRIAIPKESKSAEGRVALTPAACRELTERGHQVCVQRGAGAASGYGDADYLAAGCMIEPDAEHLWRDAELIVKVKEPNAAESAWLRPGQLLFCYLHLAAEPVLAEALCRSGATAIGFETVMEPASGMLPLLAPMSTIAGTLAAQIGSQLLYRHHGGKGRLLGGLAGAERGRCVVIGAGNAGLAAIKGLAALGAQVLAFDRSADRLELAHAVGSAVTALYAHPDEVAKAAANADLVVGAVLVPGAAAPRVLKRDAVAAMEPGSVIVDIAVDQGGCIETTRPTDYTDPVYIECGVLHFAVTNMPGAVPRTATEALSGRLLPYVLRLAGDSWRGDPALAGGVNVHAGQLVHPAVRESLSVAR